MSDSQPQQTTPMFPFMALPGMAAWQKATQDYLDRVKAVYEESAKLEGLAAQQARTMIDESARLMRESLTYTAQLNAEWRRMGAEATARTVAMVTGAGDGQGR